ncbi:hypothetical protein AAIP31_002355 [Flavobacterium psychrophilum]
MKIRVKNHILKIKRNKLNRFWNPIGQFWNSVEVKIDGEWYKCTLHFLKKNGINYLRISSPMIVDKHSSVVERIYCNGTYVELPITTLKIHLIKYLENTHKLNDYSYIARSSISNGKRMILIFSLAIIPSIIFYFVNVQYNNFLIDLLAKNNFIQSLFFFLTIAGFIGIFHPFTIRKELSKEDIEEIAKESAEKEKRNEEIKQKNTF